MKLLWIACGLGLRGHLNGKINRHRVHLTNTKAMCHRFEDVNFGDSSVKLLQNTAIINGPESFPVLFSNFLLKPVVLLA